MSVRIDVVILAECVALFLYDIRHNQCDTPEEAGHGHVMYGIIAFQSTGP